MTSSLDHCAAPVPIIVRRLSAMGRTLPLLLLTILLGGCPAIDLIEAENDWGRTYRGMVESNTILKDDYLISGTSAYQTHLIDLGKQTYAAGQKAEAVANPTAEDKATAISFYRIAALSYWKGGTTDISTLQAPVDAGDKACKSLGANAPARDCAIFGYVMPFAQHDIYAHAFAVALSTLPEHLTQQDQKYADAIRTFENVSDAFNKVQKQRAENLNNSRLPEGFIDHFVNENWSKIYCTARNWASIAARATPDYKAPQDQLEKLTDMRKALDDSNARSSC